MWPFTRREAGSLAGTMKLAAHFAARRWASFVATSGIPANVHLRDRITFFAGEFRPDLQRRFRALERVPDDLLLLIIAEGIEISGLETRRRIEIQLGIIMPPRAAG
jgi:hypothetical protein